MASNSDNSAVGMPQLDFSTFPNQIFWLVVFCVVLFAIVKFFIIPRMEDIFANRRKIIDGNIAACCTSGNGLKTFNNGNIPI